MSIKRITWASAVIAIAVGAFICGWVIRGPAAHAPPSPDVPPRSDAIDYAIAYLAVKGIPEHEAGLAKVSGQLRALFGDLSIEPKDNGKFFVECGLLASKLKESSTLEVNVSPVVTTPGLSRIGGAVLSSLMIGTSLSTQEKILKGTEWISYWGLTDKGTTASRPEALAEDDSLPYAIVCLGPGVDFSGDPRDIIGKVVTLSVMANEGGPPAVISKDFRIRGIFTCHPGFSSSIVYIPIASLQSMMGHEVNTCRELWVWVDTKDRGRQTVEEVRKAAQEVFKKYGDRLNVSSLEEISVIEMQDKYREFLSPHEQGLRKLKEAVRSLSDAGGNDKGK